MSQQENLDLVRSLITQGRYAEARSMLENMPITPQSQDLMAQVNAVLGGGVSPSQTANSYPPEQTPPPVYQTPAPTPAPGPQPQPAPQPAPSYYPPPQQQPVYYGPRPEAYEAPVPVLSFAASPSFKVMVAMILIALSVLTMVGFFTFNWLENWYLIGFANAEVRPAPMTFNNPYGCANLPPQRQSLWADDLTAFEIFMGTNIEEDRLRPRSLEEQSADPEYYREFTLDSERLADVCEGNRNLSNDEAPTIAGGFDDVRPVDRSLVFIPIAAFFLFIQSLLYLFTRGNGSGTLFMMLIIASLMFVYPFVYEYLSTEEAMTSHESLLLDVYAELPDYETDTVESRSDLFEDDLTEFNRDMEEFERQISKSYTIGWLQITGGLAFFFCLMTFVVAFTNRSPRQRGRYGR